LDICGHFFWAGLGMRGLFMLNRITITKSYYNTTANPGPGAPETGHVAETEKEIFF
jgi:hypothetical protein